MDFKQQKFYAPLQTLVPLPVPVHVKKDYDLHHTCSMKRTLLATLSSKKQRTIIILSPVLVQHLTDAKFISK